MDKYQLDQAIGEVPPSTVDVDGVVARERRAAWVRQAANPWVATAAAVVVVAFGAVLLIPGNPWGVTGPAIQGSTTSPPPSEPQSPCAGLTPTAPPAPEQPADAATRLTGVLTAAVQGQVRPGTKLQAHPAAQYPVGTPHGPLAFYHVHSPAQVTSDGGCQGGEDYYMARATLARSGQNGSIDAIVGRLGGNASPMTECPPDTVVVPDQTSSCDQQSGPDGEIIVKTTAIKTGGGPTYYQVDVTKTDGTGIILHVANVAGEDKQGGPPESPTPPLTHQQLMVIALNPGMTLYP